MPAKKPLSILFVASECFPLIKTGGLADVVGALPLALEKAGLEVTVFLPGFPKVLAGLQNTRTYANLKNEAEKKGKLIIGKTSTGVSVIALGAPHLFEFDGNPYLDTNGQDREGNAVSQQIQSQPIVSPRLRAAVTAIACFGRWCQSA